jgi:hypothetical protein
MRREGHFAGYFRMRDKLHVAREEEIGDKDKSVVLT